MSACHIAQLNIARAIAPLEDPLLAEFMAQLDAVNAMAEASPEFIWRLKTDSGNATDIRAYDDPRMIVNMSVWESIDALFAFTYKTAHTKVMNRRKDWFEPLPGPHLVLWWIPAGTIPTVEDAQRHLDYLARHGPSPTAFTFKVRFAPPFETVVGATGRSPVYPSHGTAGDPGSSPGQALPVAPTE